MEKTLLEAKQLKISLICTSNWRGSEREGGDIREKEETLHERIEGLVESEMNRKFYKGIRRNNLRPSYHQRAKETMRGKYKYKVIV